MDNQPTAKKSKVLKTEDDASSSMKQCGVSGDVGEMEIVQDDQDYFTPALMDIWPKILDYVTDSKDILSAVNASAVFSSLLEKALLPLVLPILINQYTDRFARRNVFNCRLVSRRMRSSVDNFLINYKHPRRFLREGSYTLGIVGVSRALLNIPPGINWNPFLGRYCVLVLNEHGETNDLEVLKRHGHELQKVNLTLRFYRTPEREMNALKRALHRLPNLQSLELEFPWRAVAEVEGWKNLRTPADYLPAMNSLRELKLTISGISYGPVTPPPSLYRPILLTYRNRLTSLYCGWFVFCYNSWTSISFPNLLHLQVLFGIGESSKWIRNIAKFQCPQLRSLTFTAFTANALGTEIFFAMNNCRSSLNKLHFKRSLGAALPLFQVDPSDVREFPLLTCLILCSEDAETPARHLFRNMFTKLKELKFQYASNNQRVPDESVRRSYFNMFPELKRITWTKMECRAWPRPPLYTQTVFTRQNYNWKED